MAYRLLEARAVVASDSNQSDASQVSASLTQTADNETVDLKIRVAPTDADTQIALGTIATAYAVLIFSDYPVKVRLNGSSATQLTLTSSVPPVTNVGAPSPPNCVLVITAQVTSLYIAPISSAAETACVRIIASGDPTSAYQ